MKHVVTATLLIVGVIHLLPLSGVLSADRVAQLYGVGIQDPNLAILMRHRAVLFGLLGAFLLVAAFVPALQTAAFVAGFASVASFLGLAWSTGDYNASIGRVVAADVLALACLLIGAAVAVWLRSRS
jgi:hypothetical protein